MLVVTERSFANLFLEIDLLCTRTSWWHIQTKCKKHSFYRSSTIGIVYWHLKCLDNAQKLFTTEKIPIPYDDITCAPVHFNAPTIRQFVQKFRATSKKAYEDPCYWLFVVAGHHNYIQINAEVLSILLNKRISWWRHQMKTFSALLALCAGNSPVTGEFPSQRPVTRSFDVSFDMRLA